MSCIICFFQDHYQDRLRRLSQGKRDCHEKVILEYRDDFLWEFSKLTNVNDCTTHNTITDTLKDWAAALHSFLKSIPNLPNYFNAFHDIYLEWLKGNVSNATQQLKQLSLDNELLAGGQRLNKNIFFRGRKSRDILSKEDLYHIPFNKRYLIANQRFSISGQPCLYLGLSVLDVIRELKHPIQPLDELLISSFMLKPGKTLKVADITKSFFPDTLSTVDAMGQAGGKLKFDEPGMTPPEMYAIEFHRFILASLCSFPRRIDPGSFCEEYVLPQLLTEVIRQNSLDGLVYTSTQIGRDVCLSKESYHVNRHKENIVLFTQFQEKSEYDYALLDKFLVSQPISYRDVVPISLTEIKNLGKEIIQLNNEKGYFGSLRELSELTGISTRTQFDNLYIIDSSGLEVRYFDHPIGIFHLYLLYEFLTIIRNEINKTEAS